MHIYFRFAVFDASKSRNNFGIGFSSSFIFLVWTVWGGFILHMLLSNYLAVLIQPTFEKPIDTIEDILGEY